jgi:methylmalonyl-CoA/ethylmalonyl-CoA epimerase
MAIRRIEHLGIAVNSNAASAKVFRDLLQTDTYKSEQVESEAVETMFFRVGESKIELLQSLSEDGVIQKYITKRGEGIHHVAFEVDNIYEEIDRLRSLGYRFINEQPKQGADNKLIAFLHPKDTSGMLVELCQEIVS